MFQWMPENIKKCLRVPVRIVKLLISLWMVADVVSDAFNSKKYPDYSRETRAYDRAHTNGKNQRVHPDIVSYWYFVASVAVWFTTPAIFLAFVYGDPPYLLSLIGRKEDWKFPCVYCTMKAPAGYAVSVFFLYVAVPAIDICLGVKNLLCHESYKAETSATLNSVFFASNPSIRKESDAKFHAETPAWKTFEQLGEAIPQILLAITFYSKNCHWLDSEELIFGVATISLSGGRYLVRNCERLLGMREVRLLYGDYA